MVLSRRAGVGVPQNAYTRLRAEAGTVLDLSDTNPTRHGLGSAQTLDILARATVRAARYDPDPRGPVSARQALAAERGGQVDDYWLTASTSEAYSWLMTLLCDPGDAVAVPVPGYPLVEPLARSAGVRVVGYPLFYVHPYGWSVDLDALGAVLADPEVRAVVVVNPGNPTGAYLDPVSAEAVLDLCARTGTAVLADEVFWPFADDREQPAPRLAGRQETLVIAFDGLSKLLCAPQLKLSWLRISGPAQTRAELAVGLDQIADSFLSVAGPVALALPELLGVAEEQISRVRTRLAGNLQTARSVLAAPCRVRRTDAGWTVLVDVPRSADDDQLTARLLNEAQLAVHPGWLYDLADPGSLVLSLLLEPDRFAEGCRRLRAVVVP